MIKSTHDNVTIFYINYNSTDIYQFASKGPKMHNTLLKLLVLMISFEISCGSIMRQNLEELNSPTRFLNKVKELILEKNNEISSKCERQMEHYFKGLEGGEAWAWRMLDAAAKLPSGLMEGNVVDLGFFDECLQVESTTTSSENEMVLGKYCIGTIPLETIMQYFPIPQQNNMQTLEIANPEQRTLTNKNEELGIHLATCLPSACSASDIQKIYEQFLQPANMTFNEELCQIRSNGRLDGGSIAALTFLGVILGAIVLSTAYSIAIHYLERKPAHQMLTAFSVYTNVKKIIQTNNSPGQINCLHGIRVISTMWVILGHRYALQGAFPLRNSFAQIEFYNNAENMFIIGATVSVDTFFLMSGLVVVYIFMTASHKGVKFNIASYYLHRYLRLTPVVAVTVLIHATLLKHLGSGPLWPSSVQETLITSCQKNWWKALLYIQNYKQPEDICVPQSWYLSVDMQLFLMSPLLLIPLKIWPKSTLLATAFLAFCSVISSFLTVWFLELGPNLEVSSNPERRRKHMKYYYLATWTRAGPWLIGFILGYAIFIVKQRKHRLFIKKVVVMVLWVAAMAVLCTCLFAGHDSFVGKYDKLQASFYVSLVRPSWAIAVGWVIFACVTGNGGPVDRFLSLPLFQVMSKITFTMYMVHYAIIFMITAQMRNPPMFSNPHQMYVFWGDFALTSIIALIFTLAFESPFIMIENLLLGKGNKKGVQPAAANPNESKLNAAS